ncbi:MAG TPA: ABC transporter substrate-binding protein [Gammaproteobacteria bacterium]|nr:ABC transporter substrate-binding protein [Gammaproteobacteria bacterium]
MHLVVRSFVVLLLSLYACIALAQERPEVLLERVTQEMLTALKQNDAEIKRNHAKLVEIIDKILVPHVDLHDMSRWVVGRNAWLKASASEKTRFAQEFKDLMIRTYSSSLTAYSNQEIIYKPIRGSLEGKKRVQVSSQIIEPGRSPIQVSYRLVLKGGGWKVYDIIIEGVSLLKGFKSQFEADIQEHGLEKVIEKMKTHNQKPR